MLWLGVRQSGLPPQVVSVRARGDCAVSACRIRDVPLYSPQNVVLVFDSVKVVSVRARGDCTVSALAVSESLLFDSVKVVSFRFCEGGECAGAGGLLGLGRDAGSATCRDP